VSNACQLRSLRLRAVFVVSASLIATGCGKKSAATPQAEGPLPVKVEEARAIPVNDTSDYVATLKSRNSAVIMPQVEGQIVQIAVRSGDQVGAGKLLMEIDPLHQKTLPDFLLTEKLLGIKTVDIRCIKKDGNRLYWEREGRRVRIQRIYNRAIVDELERKGAKLEFDFRDDLNVEWAGHPNWYFRISKYSIPYLKHASVPKTWFLDQMESVPEDLENYALKPLYSFAGRGVVIAPTKKDIAAVPVERLAQYILQERLHFEPVIQTPFGGTKVEVRVMYIWVDELTPVLTILRMGRGLMMGVDHNRNMEWVGSSAGLF